MLLSKLGGDFKTIVNYSELLYKIECFIDITATDKSDNLTCVIIHDNLNDNLSIM